MRILRQNENDETLNQALAEAEAGPAGQMLRGLAQEFTPDSRFSAELGARLKASGEAKGGTIRWVADRHHRAWPALPHRAVAFAGMVLLVALMLAGAFAISRPKAVSAAAILARAATAGGWQTLHVTWTARAQYGPNQFTGAQNEGWFQAPDHVRLDDHRRTTAGESFRVIVVSDGNQEWQYDGQNNLVYLQDPERTLLSLFQLADLATIRQAQSQAGYDLKQLNDETVAGRSAYVLDLVAKPGAQVKWAHVRLWIDRQYYLTLRQEAWDTKGSLVASSAFTSIEFDQPVGDGKFTYTPPADVAILDMRPLPAGAQAQASLWQAVAAQAGFPLFAPADSSKFGVPFRPYYDPSRRVVTVAYHNAPGAVTLYLEQGPADALLLPEQGKPITVSSLPAHYLADRQGVTVSVDRAGTRILLHAVHAAADTGSAVVYVAQTLAQVGHIEITRPGSAGAPRMWYPGGP